jgi:hypothetical protein
MLRLVELGGHERAGNGALCFKPASTPTRLTSTNPVGRCTGGAIWQPRLKFTPHTVLSFTPVPPPIHRLDAPKQIGLGKEKKEFSPLPIMFSHQYSDCPA